MRTTKNILSHSAFWMANKRIAKHFKSNDAAIFLAYLIDKEDYYRSKNELKDIDGELYFFATSNKIEEDVNIGYKKQKKLIDLFIKEGLIDTQLYGIPAKLHFTIRHDKILLLATSSFAQTVKLDSPDGQDIYKEYNHQETEIKNTTKEGNYDELQAHPQNTLETYSTTSPDAEKEKSCAKKEKDAQAVELMEYYNMATNQTRSTATSGRGSKNVGWIKALMRKGYSPDEIRLMIDYKCYEWGDSHKMRIHLLNPETIFKRHGEEYIEQAIQARDNPEVMNAIKKAKQKETGGSVKVSADIYDTLKNW